MEGGREGGERNEGGTEGQRIVERVAPIHLHRYGQDVDLSHLYRTLEGGREGRKEGGRGEGGREEGKEGRRIVEKSCTHSSPSLQARHRCCIPTEH